MSSEILESTKFFWEVIKDGVKFDSNTVSALPQGQTMQSLSGWQGPVIYNEFYDQLSFLFGEKVVDFKLAVSWMYNGTYIGNFRVDADGTVDLLSSVQITISTDEAYFDESDVVQLPYAITVVFHNITGGTERTTIRAIARGDGGGMSVG